MAIKKLDKEALRETILKIEGLDNTTRTQLLGLLNEQKRYGLVWEDKPEAVEEELREKLPVLTEVCERRILSSDAESPNHILIEGDNLHALTALTYTHEGKVDVIYIDPPYNTGNKDFIYNDSFVDSEDGFRHSKWLSFMSKRLRIAKKLLSDQGVIFISIDDNEQANLKLLCDEVFDFISVVPRVAKKGSDQGTYFRPTKDYILVYAKRMKNLKGFIDPYIVREERQYQYQENGRAYRKGHSLYQASLDPLRGCVNQRYYIEAPDGTLIIPPGELPKDLIDGGKIVPSSNNDKVWRWSKDSYLKKKHLILFSKSKKSPLIDSNGNPTEWNVYEKKYQDEEDKKDNKKLDNLGSLPNDIIYDYTNSLATKSLSNIGINFSYSKPIELIKYLIEITDKQSNITILDFFAGSGTTLHATMQLNAEDGGHRQCILVTNNENNICEEVTYERNKRVINGYTTPKGEQVEGLKNNNLRYYKTDFVDRERTPRNMRCLMAAATDLLCIKENLYNERMEFGSLKLKPQIARYYTDGKRQMLVVYREENIDYFVQELEKMEIDNKIKIYIFSPGRYAFDDEFFSVQDKVTLCALPAAIYDAYKSVLPSKPDRLLDEEDSKDAVSQGSLFEEKEDAQ